MFVPFEEEETTTISCTKQAQAATDGEKRSHCEIKMAKKEDKKENINQKRERKMCALIKKGKQRKTLTHIARTWII